MTGKVRKPRSDSKMYQLPKDVLDQVNCLLLDENMRYSDIQHWLKEEHGMKVSLSSISNYAIRIYKAAQRVADDLERTKYLLDFIGCRDGLDAGKATTAILKSGLLQKIATAEEEFNEMPVEKAGRLLVELERVELAEKRMANDQEKKMDLAYKQFESVFMERFKAYPDLSMRLATLLKEFMERERLCDGKGGISYDGRK